MDSVFRVCLSSDHLVFCAAHFITWREGECEPIHGHNWRVRAVIEGPLDENHYVADFISLRESLRSLLGELDHRVLLPTQHREIKLTYDEREVTATFRDRRWVFPRAECALLPVPNTTAEMIAHYLAQRWREALRTLAPAVVRLELQVEECEGQAGICVLERERSPVPSAGGHAGVPATAE